MMPKSIVADVIITAADTPEIKAIAAKAAGAAFVKADTAIIKKNGQAKAANILQKARRKACLFDLKMNCRKIADRLLI